MSGEECNNCGSDVTTGLTIDLMAARENCSEHQQCLLVAPHPHDHPQQYRVPSREVDLVWKRHIIETRAYIRDCEALFGPNRYLHRSTMVTTPGKAAGDLAVATLGSLVSLTVEEEEIEENRSTFISWSSEDERQLKLILHSANNDAEACIRAGGSSALLQPPPLDDDMALLEWEAMAIIPEEAEKEYLNLHHVMNKGLGVASPYVDLLWHRHMVDTVAYDRFCGRHFGRYVHHDVGYEDEWRVDFPTMEVVGAEGMEDDNVFSLLNPMPTQEDFDDTLGLYEKVLGSPPPLDIWSRSATSSGHGHSPHGHNPHGHYPHIYTPIPPTDNPDPKAVITANGGCTGCCCNCKGFECAVPGPAVAGQYSRGEEEEYEHVRVDG
eukprot:jgi/Bigna1/126877/aug1.3_g1585